MDNPKEPAALHSHLTGDYGGRIYELHVDKKVVNAWFVPYGYGQPAREEESRAAEKQMRDYLSECGLAHLLSEEM